MSENEYRRWRMHGLGIIVGALAIAGLSNPDDAPDDALAMWEQITKQICADPMNPTGRERIDVFRAVLRKAFGLTER